MKKITLLLLSTFFLGGVAKADEGMWLLHMLKQINEAEMKQMGLNLSTDDIYNINKSSLKDAVVMLSGGSCTAEMISSKGLMLTNHHCAYGAIQSHSSVENDYLTDGFWAMTKKEELPVDGMTASYLVRIEDVTGRILKAVKDAKDEGERMSKIQQLKQEIVKEATADTEYDAKVKTFFEGNEFYLFVYKTYRDVRLVGAPPSSVGKFGGDTDNWMWPRHTGDFSLLRVYANKEGGIADYSEDNVPYQSKHHFPISLNGVKDSDFTMIMGYPGSTDRYLCSYGVEQELSIKQPSTVKIRGKRLDLMKEDMNADQAIRIKYASKYARVSNYWKYFIGQSKGLKRLKVYDKKQALENEFNTWVAKSDDRKEKYGDAVSLLETGYKAERPFAKPMTYINECAFGSEIVILAWRMGRLQAMLDADEPDQEKIKQTAEGLKARVKSHFKDYNAPTDKKVSAALFKMYAEDVDASFHPEMFSIINKKFKGDYGKFVEYMFKKSFLSSEEKAMAFLDNPSAKVIKRDPAMKLMSEFIGIYRSKIGAGMQAASMDVGKGYRLFVAGLREMNSSKKYYPNANSTMRLTYGKVGDYFPADAVHYDFFTTANGIVQKEDPKDDEFIVPEKLMKLIEKKDFGQYGQNGELPICFISNNDITGGNSGSPVINGNGHLIGCAFDGNWEAMSGDIAFEPELQRTISVDIRYVLFIIDKYAGATHLINEMTLVKEGPKQKTLGIPIEPMPVEN